MEIYGFPRFFERFLGEKGILKKNRLISTGAVVGAGCPPTSISGVRPQSSCSIAVVRRSYGNSLPEVDVVL